MAKKSMIEREKKRINLTNKYSEKRKNLLVEYKNMKDFNLKLGEREKFENYSVEFKDLRLEDFKNYKAVIGEFKINNSFDSNDNYKWCICTNV